MAKRRRSKARRALAPSGGFRRRRHNPSGIRRQRRSNPTLPITLNEMPATIGGALAGGVAASWGPNAILGARDTGWVGYLANGAVAVLGSLFLQRYSRSLSLGWLIGGLTMTGGRIFDDLFGKQIVQFSMPAGALGSYYRSSPWALPAPITNDLTAPMLPPALPAAAIGAGSAVLAKAKMAGLGWNPRFLSRLAA